MYKYEINQKAKKINPRNKLSAPFILEDFDNCTPVPKTPIHPIIAPTIYDAICEEKYDGFKSKNKPIPKNDIPIAYPVMALSISSENITFFFSFLICLFPFTQNIPASVLFSVFQAFQGLR